MATGLQFSAVKSAQTQPGFNLAQAAQAATKPAASSNTVSDSTSGANPAALAQAVQQGNAAGSVDANGNYVPPATQAPAALPGTTTISGNASSPVSNASSSVAESSGGASTSLQMPTGAAANSIFDPTTGQQVSPSEAAFNAMNATGTAAPQDSSSGSAAVTAATETASPPPQQPTSSPAVDNFFSSNESITQQAQQLQDYLSPPQTTAQLQTELGQLNADQASLAGLNTQYMNIQNVMAGSEDDIRAEIQSAGGMATNSQVMALSTARNKVLLQQSKTIQESIANQKNIIANDTSLYNQDKTLAQQQYTDRSNAVKMVEANQKNIDTAQKSGAALLLKTMGAAGVYASLNSDPAAVANFEQAIGWNPGDLQAAATSNQAGTVTTYQTNPDGTVSKITTKNGQPVSNVEQKPKVTVKKNIIPTDYSNKVDSLLNSGSKDGKNKGRGQDGLYDPSTFVAARNAWIADGYNASTFDKTYGKGLSQDAINQVHQLESK